VSEKSYSSPSDSSSLSIARLAWPVAILLPENISWAFADARTQGIDPFDYHGPRRLPRACQSSIGSTT